MKKILGALLVAALFLTVGSKDVEAGYLDLSITLPSDLVMVDNGKEDLLYTYLSFLNKEPSSHIKNWDELKQEDKDLYDKKVTASTRDLIRAYSDLDFSGQQMSEIYLEFLDWVDEMSVKKYYPITTASGEVMFVLPQLTDPYLTYMPIRKITSRSSRQWAFKPFLEPDEQGFQRYGEAYSIALGTYFGSEIGTIYEIKFKDGKVIKGVLTDIKADKDTDSTNRYADDSRSFNGTKGNILEFVMNDELPQFYGLDYQDLVRTINKIVYSNFSVEIESIKKVGAVDVVF